MGGLLIRSYSRVRLNIPLRITSDVTVTIVWFEKCKIGQALHNA